MSLEHTQTSSFPSPPRSYKHVNENPLFTFLPLLPCPSPPFHHSSLQPRCNQRVWENTTHCLADPAMDAGWIWRQGCSAWWLTCLAGDNLFFFFFFFLERHENDIWLLKSKEQEHFSHLTELEIFVYCVNFWLVRLNSIRKLQKNFYTSMDLNGYVQFLWTNAKFNQ